MRRSCRSSTLLLTATLLLFAAGCQTNAQRKVTPASHERPVTTTQPEEAAPGHASAMPPEATPGHDSAATQPDASPRPARPDLSLEREVGESASRVRVTSPPATEAAATSPTAPATQPATARPATQPATTQPRRDAFPHMRIDLENRAVEFDAEVILREADWLELLACSPGTREHESILTTPARPSHIHLALVMLGLEPGAPLTTRWNEDRTELLVSPPHGPPVQVTVVYEANGARVETPANEWIIDQNTQQVMPGDAWLFAGSAFGEWEGERIYHADANGTVIALVNFGDDLLTRPTEMTNQTDEATWGPNTDAIPPVGTQVTIRLTPAKQARDPEARPKVFE